MNNSNINDLIACALNLDKKVLSGSGSFIFSSCETLKKGSVYFLGINPGGDPKEEIKTLKKEIKGFATQENNAFIDGCWASSCEFGNDPSKCKCGDDCQKGQAALQKKVKCLFENLKVCLRKDVCASNLIFERTKDTSELNIEETAEQYWPIHEKILEIVKPSLLLVHGVKMDLFLYKKLGLEGDPEYFPSGHSNWQCRKFKGKSNKRSLNVIILPHFSRYNPDREEVINKIKPLLKKRVRSC